MIGPPCALSLAHAIDKDASVAVFVQFTGTPDIQLAIVHR